jgi:hypothetical protein
MTDEKKSADVLKLMQGAEKPDELAALLRRVDQEWPREIEMANLAAKMAWLRFTKLKAQGFSDPQALQLVMKWMWP